MGIEEQLDGLLNTGRTLRSASDCAKQAISKQFDLMTESMSPKEAFAKLKRWIPIEYIEHARFELIKRRLIKCYGDTDESEIVETHDRIFSQSTGVFYIVNLTPESPSRVKLGHTTDLRSRLAAHRTCNPTADLAGAWRCRRRWELTAIDFCSDGMKHVGGEVYEQDPLDLLELTRRADHFFLMMPRRRK